ncbi:MAG: hypothetical protein ACYDHP_06365 [Ferrimicrobium sp.]
MDINSGRFCESWVSEECERQALGRRQIDENESRFFDMAVAQDEMEVEERRKRSAASAQAIGKLCVGQSVRARVRGREPIGRITWIGTRRVEIVFKIASGEERTHCPYAS